MSDNQKAIIGKILNALVSFLGAVIGVIFGNVL